MGYGTYTGSTGSATLAAGAGEATACFFSDLGSVFD
jgi:hypothetical protein